MPRRRDSFSLHDDLPADHKSIQARKASIAEEFRNRTHSIQIGTAAEPIPEFAVETPALETPAVDGNRARHQLGYVEPPIPRTTANPDKPTNNNEPGVHMTPSDPKSENAVTDGRALQGASIRNLTGGDAKSMREAAVQGLKTTPAKATLAMRPTPSSPATQATAQAGVSSNANKPLRSPPLEKTPLEKTPPSAAAAQRTAAAGNRNVSSASAASTAKPPTKPASSATNGAPKPATSTARSSATGPTGSAAAKKAPTADTSSGTGFHKPKPKSPTRPAKLPSRLLAPTASSISKVAGAENNTTTQKRRESHGSLAQNKAIAASKLRGETLKHTSSHNRPSVGPPPSSVAHKKPATSTTKPAGDSFLERMMRPTAASANKAVNHDTSLSSPKPAVPKTSTPAHSRPVTREKVHAEKPEKKEDMPKKVAEEKTLVDKILEEKQADPKQPDPNPKPAERGQLVEEPKIREPRFSRPSLEERVSEPISPKTETPPKAESPSPPPAGELPPPKAEAPPVAESKEDAIKTEVPKTYQEPHQDPPMPSPPKASLPSHTVPKVIKTERTISVTDMENSDGTIKKLPPGAIPIPKIAKKKKKPSVESPKVPESPKRNSKPDVTDVPKEKKRDFLLEVREEEKRHRRMSERPSMVKNPTTIPEAAEEADEEIDDHQLHTPSQTMGTRGSEADISGGSEQIPRSSPKKTPSPKKPLGPAKETAPPGLQPTEKRERRDSLADNALESAAISNSDVDDVDIALGAPSPSSQIKSQATGRRLSQVAEKAMDYAAQAVDAAAKAVDDAVAHKTSTAQRADEAEKEEENAVQDLSKGHPLTSAMLNGSALDTDDEYTPTPSAEARNNPFDDLEKKPRRESKAGDGNFSVAPTFKEGEEKVAEDRQNGNAESKDEA